MLTRSHVYAMPAASAAAFSAAAAAQPQIVKSQDCAATPSTLLCSTLLPEHGPHTSCLTHNIAGCVCRASLGTLGAVLLTGYCAASWHASTLSVRHQNSAWDDQWAAANPPFFRSPRILPDALASSNTVITELAVSVRPPSGLLTTALPCTGNKVLQLLLSCSIILYHCLTMIVCLKALHLGSANIRYQPAKAPGLHQGVGLPGEALFQ